MPRPGVGNRDSKHVHKQVAHTAVGLCYELYDKLMSDDTIYTAWKKQNPGANARQLELRFVKRNVERCVPAARATLTAIMTTTTDEALKETIYEALLADNTLIRGRAEG